MDKNYEMLINPNDVLRSLPAVDGVLQDSVCQALVERLGRQVVISTIREVLEGLRADLRAGVAPSADGLSAHAVALLAESRLSEQRQPHLRPVINATGIILHTGLGRAFMPESARVALSTVTGYCNLQQDLETGKRDQREDCLRELACSITGAEDVLVVNNNAAATLLVLAALSRGREAVISRGELIEIGGSFRLPDIMSESGAILREVGTTNKTHLRDYEKAMTPAAGVILKAHQSNYKIMGFTHEVKIAELVAVGRKHGVPVVDDLGCGALVPLESFGLTHEGTVQESLAAGADVVLFSTDKLIGGPQGGMIVGRRDLIARIRSHTLYRAFRVCKLTLGALEAVLRLFKAPDHLSKTHPLYMMLAKTPDSMKAQAEELVRQLASVVPQWQLSVTGETSFLGGGTLPGEGIPSFAVRLKVPGMGADEVSRRFRMAVLPVVGRIQEDSLVLDMRTVFPADLAGIVKGAESL